MIVGQFFRAWTRLQNLEGISHDLTSGFHSGREVWATHLCVNIINIIRSVSILKDKVSDQPIIWVREIEESESGQTVLEKVKWTSFDAYLWQTIWNHAKKSMEGSKLSDLVFLQWEITDWQEIFAKNGENKGN